MRVEKGKCKTLLTTKYTENTNKQLHAEPRGRGEKLFSRQAANRQEHHIDAKWFYSSILDVEFIYLNFGKWVSMKFRSFSRKGRKVSQGTPRKPSFFFVSTGFNMEFINLDLGKLGFDIDKNFVSRRGAEYAEKILNL